MALQPPPPPVPGPSTAQLPTQLLLNGLADAHSLYFPKRHHLVQPDTQEITTHEQRQDAEQKIALLKSVLSGWMQGVELDLDRTSSGQSRALSWLGVRGRVWLGRVTGRCSCKGRAEGIFFAIFLPSDPYFSLALRR